VGATHPLRSRDRDNDADLPFLGPSSPPCWTQPPEILNTTHLRSSPTQYAVWSIASFADVQIIPALSNPILPRRVRSSIVSALAA
jgi:hypothetical protein